jgi:CRP/FNR family transcriptional regulator, nitrogen fixation regulation protein
MLRDAQIVIHLAMSRQDIADYLGLRIETISRTPIEFERSAAIARPTSRQAEIRNRAALMHLNAKNERGCPVRPCS